MLPLLTILCMMGLFWRLVFWQCSSHTQHIESTCGLRMAGKMRRTLFRECIRSICSEVSLRGLRLRWEVVGRFGVTC